MTIIATQYIKRMHGGAQSHLLACNDGNYYVVKFRNNPQHVRVLANELLATRLAEALGLPVPRTEIVEVSDWLIKGTEDLCFVIATRHIRCEPGLHFGSRLAIHPKEGQIIDLLPTTQLHRVRNRTLFACMLAFDKWVGNVDDRQAAFWRRAIDRKYSACFIDQGHCFNVGEWTFPDLPLRGAYPANEVYAEVNGWESFEPYLSSIEQIPDRTLWSIAEQIPPEWYDSAWDDLESLVRSLLRRRPLVRNLILSFRDSQRKPFPLWVGDTKC